MQTTALKSGISALFGKVPKFKFDAKTLGYIHPDGKITFQSETAAMEYAKNRALQALNSPRAFERAIIVDGNTICKEYDGKLFSAPIDSYLKTQNKAVLIHGHPAGGVISADDYGVLMTRDWLKSIVAINKKGEISSLTKHERPWYETVISNEHLAQYHRDFVLGSCQTIKTKINEFMQAPMNYLKQLDRGITKGKTKAEIKELKEVITFKEKFAAANKKCHEFWSTKGKHFCVDYDTNYTNWVS